MMSKMMKNTKFFAASVEKYNRKSQKEAVQAPKVGIMTKGKMPQVRFWQRQQRFSRQLPVLIKLWSSRRRKIGRQNNSAFCYTETSWDRAGRPI